MKRLSAAILGLALGLTAMAQDARTFTASELMLPCELAEQWLDSGSKELLDSANTLAHRYISHFFRTDYSVFRSVDFDAKGMPAGKDEGPVLTQDQARALNAFVQMYRLTGEDDYLKQSHYLASYLVRHLPADGLPSRELGNDGEADTEGAALAANGLILQYECDGNEHLLQCAEALLAHLDGNFPALEEARRSYARATSHGRLLLTSQDFQDIRKQLSDGSNPVMSRMHELLMWTADELPDADLEYRFDGSGMRLSPAPKLTYDRLSAYSYAYRMSGDRKYLDKACRIIDQACALYDWNGYHFLDVSGIISGLSIAYDWLYDELDPAMRARMRNAVYEKAFLEAGSFQMGWWYDCTHNWNQVCNAALVMAAIAMREDFGRVAGNLILNAIKTNTKAVKAAYAPNGCYPEGPGYWNYGNTYQALLCCALDSAYGCDFGISARPGVDGTAEYEFNCYGAAHKMFNYYDNSDKEFSAAPLWYFAYRFRKPWLLSKELEFMKDDSYRRQSYIIFMPLMVKFASRLKLDDLPAPENKLYEGKGETPIVTWHKDWSCSETDVFLGVKGGKAVTNHGHMDAGSFVFDRWGIRWASDPGNVKYADIEPVIKAMGGDYWEKGQDSFRWKVYPMNNYWHNTLTINGSLHDINGAGEVSVTMDENGMHGAILDISKPFRADSCAVIRTIFVDGQDRLVIEDRVHPLRQDASVRFTWCTETEVSLDGNGAVLSRDGRSLSLSSEGADVRYSLRDTSGERFITGKRFIDMDWNVPCGSTVTVKTILQ